MPVSTMQPIPDLEQLRGEMDWKTKKRTRVALTELCITPVGQDTWMSPHFLMHRIHQEHGWLAIGLIAVKLQCGLFFRQPPHFNASCPLLSSYVQGHQRGYRLESRSAINPSPADFGSLIFSPASLCIYYYHRVLVGSIGR
jgi:hypothetical protein